MRWKIEKRLLERIGHVVRVGNERLKNGDCVWIVRVFGWERHKKGMERKTVLYLERILNESGVDCKETFDSTLYI